MFQVTHFPREKKGFLSRRKGKILFFFLKTMIRRHFLNLTFPVGCFRSWDIWHSQFQQQWSDGVSKTNIVKFDILRSESSQAQNDTLYLPIQFPLNISFPKVRRVSLLFPSLAVSYPSMLTHSRGYPNPFLTSCLSPTFSEIKSDFCLLLLPPTFSQIK